MQFTKLFQSILDSTIWQEPSETKVLWITMLAMADRNGEVQASIPGLARRAGVTMQQCETALQCLLSPDKYSRTPAHDGRRISAVDGGWQLLNHAKYRALLSAEERREYNRKKQAEYRANKAVSASVIDTSMTVNDSQSQSAMCTHSEGEGEGDGDKKKTNTTPDGAECEEVYRAYVPQRRGGRKEAYKAIRSALKDVTKEILIDRVKAYVSSAETCERIKKGEVKFIPHLATWLNAGRYDEDATPSPYVPREDIIQNEY
jgi:hypothetical protein